MPHQMILHHIAKRHHEGAKVSDAKKELKEKGYTEKDIEMMADHYMDNMHAISAEFRQAMGDIVQGPPLTHEHFSKKKQFLNSDRIEQIIPVFIYMFIGLVFGILSFGGMNLNPSILGFALFYSIFLKGIMLLIIGFATYFLLHTLTLRNISFKKSLWIAFMLFTCIDFLSLIQQTDFYYQATIFASLPLLTYLILTIPQVMLFNYYSECEIPQAMFIVFVLVPLHIVLEVEYLHFLAYVIS